jgi:hypothetical protein
VTVLRIALAQLNPIVGDLDGNLSKLLAAYDRAEQAGCDIVAFPELATTGYPPEDLVLKPGFVADNLAALQKLAAHPVGAPRWSGSSTPIATSTTPLRCAPTVRCSAPTASGSCRTTRCSTRPGTSRRAPTAIRSSCT